MVPSIGRLAVGLLPAAFLLLSSASAQAQCSHGQMGTPQSAQFRGSQPMSQSMQSQSSSLAVQWLMMWQQQQQTTMQLQLVAAQRVRLNSIQQQPGSQMSLIAGQPDQLNGLTDRQRIKSLEQQIGALQQQMNGPQQPAQLNTLQQQVSALQGQVNSLSKPPLALVGQMNDLAEQMRTLQLQSVASPAEVIAMLQRTAGK